MRHHVLRWLVPLAILHGLLYMLLVPPWQHYDEPGHFEYVRLVALTGRQPGYAEIDATTNREIGDSMYRFGFFPAGVRPDLIGAEPRVTGINQHLSPPLYYALAAIPVRPLQHLAIEQQLYAARSLSVLFYVLTIIVAWRIAVIVVPDEPTPQIAIPLMLLMMPTFADIMSAVNSDVLLNFAGVAMFLGCVLLIRDGLRPTGLAFTCLALLVAFLTKRTAVGLLIPAACTLIWAFWKPPLRFWPTILVAGGSALARS